MSKFDGSEGEFVSLQTAQQMTQSYRNGVPFFINQGVKGIFFGKEKLQEILSQKGAVGLRIYYALANDGSGTIMPQMVIVGADKDRNDQLTGKLLDRGRKCPPDCPESIAL